ncbi:hypothetical protein U9M48_020458 [Paspalum notatum var. saurae]|uniref:DUF4219 domain-containing protein n=1 Tax=Paspalum notatum var. saurae TaxID=547442 RepID=A0AAQ3TG56_PASNO
MMKVMLEARGLWEAVEAGTTERQEDRWAMEAILRAVPPEMHQSLGAKKTAKEAWDSLKKMRTGSDLVKRARIRRLRGGSSSSWSSRTAKELKSFRSAWQPW